MASSSAAAAAPIRRILAKAPAYGTALLLAAGARELLFVRTSSMSSSMSSQATLSASSGVSGFALERDAGAFQTARRAPNAMDSAIVGTATWPFDETYAGLTRLHACVDARGATLLAESSALVFVRLELDSAKPVLNVVARCTLPECQFVRFGNARGTALVRRDRDADLVYVLPSSTQVDI